MPSGFDVWPLSQSNKAITELTVTAFLLLKHPVPFGIGYVPVGGCVPDHPAHAVRAREICNLLPD